MAISFREISVALDGKPQSDVKDLIARLSSKADVESILGDINATGLEIVALEIEMKAQGFAEYIPAISGRVMPAPDDD